MSTEDVLVFRTSDTERWGAGKGGDLDAVEVDVNFWTLLSRIVVLEDNPGSPAEIVEFTFSGTTFSVVLSDATVLGPYPLPTSAMRWTGDYSPGFAYKVFDLFDADGEGVYMVLQNHDGATEFDPDETLGGEPLYHLVFGHTTIYDIGFFIPGPITEAAGTESTEADADDVLFQQVAVRDFFIPSGVGSSIGRAYMRVTEAQDLTFVISVNGTPVGSISILSGQNTGTITMDSPAVVGEGSVLTVDPPEAAAPTETARDLSVTFRAIRGAPEA